MDLNELRRLRLQSLTRGQAEQVPVTMSEDAAEQGTSEEEPPSSNANSNSDSAEQVTRQQQSEAASALVAIPSTTPCNQRGDVVPFQGPAINMICVNASDLLAVLTSSLNVSSGSSATRPAGVSALNQASKTPTPADAGLSDSPVASVVDSPGSGRPAGRQRGSSPDLDLRSSDNSSTSRPAGGSSSPDFSLSGAQGPSTSTSAAAERQRIPSPDLSFLSSHSWRSARRSSPEFFSRNAPRPSTSAAAAERQRAPSPDLSTQNIRSTHSSMSARRSSPEFFSRSAPRPSTSAAAGRHRLPSPDLSILNSPPARRARASRGSRSPSPDPVASRATGPASRAASPDFSFLNQHSRGTKRGSSPKKAPPKKRGRPPKKREGDADKICVICREEAKGKLLNTRCGHFFHEACLKRWTSQPGQARRFFKTCPVCGQDFDPEEVNPVFL